jgi:hypothetical protein
VEHVGDTRNAYKILVGNPKRKKPLGRSRRRWKDIKIDVRQGVAWIRVARIEGHWWAFANTVMNLRVA